MQHCWPYEIYELQWVEVAVAPTWGYSFLRLQITPVSKSLCMLRSFLHSTSSWGDYKRYQLPKFLVRFLLVTKPNVGNKSFPHLKQFLNLYSLSHFLNFPWTEEIHVGMINPPSPIQIKPNKLFKHWIDVPGKNVDFKYFIVSGENLSLILFSWQWKYLLHVRRCKINLLPYELKSL